MISKVIFLFVLAFCSLGVFAQNEVIPKSNISYFKRIGDYSSLTKQKKATFKRVSSTLESGITKVEYIQLSNDQLRKVQFLQNGNPVGNWKEYDSNGRLVSERNLDSIAYCEEMEKKTKADSLKEERLIDPYFVGGEKEMYSFLGKNMKYPQYAKNNFVSARVIAQFVIEKNGEVTNVCVFDQDDLFIKLLEYETIRVVSSMPDWVPGELDDEPVRVQFNLPITFRFK